MTSADEIQKNLLRFVKLIISIGIVPVSWVCWLSNTSRFVKSPIVGGIGPLIWLSDMDIISRFDSTPNWAGIVEFKRFSWISKKYRSVISNISEGIVELILFADRLNSKRFNKPISVGIDPSILFPSKAKYSMSTVVSQFETASVRRKRWRSYSRLTEHGGIRNLGWYRTSQIILFEKQCHWLKKTRCEASFGDAYTQTLLSTFTYQDFERVQVPWPNLLWHCYHASQYQ